MRIQRKSIDVGGLLPSVVAALAGLPNEASRHAELGLRTPRGAYNASLQRIASGFEAVLAARAKMLATRSWTKDKTTWNRDLVPAQEHLLYVLFEHTEHCRNILRCFAPVNADFGKLKVTKEFDKVTAPYRKHIGGIVNKMKHGQRRVAAMVMHDDNVAVPGYFIESLGYLGPRKLPVMQPDSDIHPRSDTAFSLHRDLRYNLWAVYAMSEHLVEAISSMELPAKAGPPQTDADLGSRLFVIADRVASLPPVFYPDEVRQAVPAVWVSDSPGVLEVAVEFPSKRFQPRRPTVPARLTVSWSGDGATDTFKYPYALRHS